MTVEVNEFKQAMQLWASGVTVVATYTEQGGAQGMTATSFSSVSLEPPQILVCLNSKTDTGEGIQKSQHFSVNILTTEQEVVSNEFAGGANQQKRFDNVSWHKGLFGMPIIEGCLSNLECRVLQQVRAGTHWIFVGEVLNAVCHSGDPLLYYRSAYRKLMS